MPVATPIDHLLEAIAVYAERVERESRSNQERMSDDDPVSGRLVAFTELGPALPDGTVLRMEGAVYSGTSGFVHNYINVVAFRPGLAHSRGEILLHREPDAGRWVASGPSLQDSWDDKPRGLTAAELINRQREAMVIAEMAAALDASGLDVAKWQTEPAWRE